MEAFRAIGLGGEDARCDSIIANNCSATDNAFSLKTTICVNRDDLPSNILANTDSADQSFVERACCTPASSSQDVDYFSTTGSSTQAPFSTTEEDVCVTKSRAKQLGASSNSTNLAAIIGGVVGGAVLLVLILYVMIRSYRRADGGGGGKAATVRRGEWSPPVARAVPEEEGNVAVTTIGDPIPAPSAPCSPGHPSGGTTHENEEKTLQVDFSC